MLKSIYKTFSTLILIFSLLNLQVTPTYAQANGQRVNINQESQDARSAHALSKNNSSSGGQSSGAGDQDDMASTMMSISTGDADVHLGDMLTYVVLIATGLFLVSIWEYQNMALDMQIALAAGVIQITSVIATITATRTEIDASDYKIEKKEDGSVNNMQVDALKKQKESYISLKDHAALKWKIETAGAAAYTGAAAIAFYDGHKIGGLSKSCATALGVGVTKGGSPSCGVAQKELGLIGVNLMSIKGSSSTRLNNRAKHLATLKAEIVPCTLDLGKNTATVKLATTINLKCNALIAHLTTNEPLTKKPSPEDATSGDFLNFKKFLKDKLRNFQPPELEDNYVLADSMFPDHLDRYTLLDDTLAYQNLSFLGSYPTGVYSNNFFHNSQALVSSEVEGFKDQILSMVFSKAHALDMKSFKWIGLSGALLLAFIEVRKAVFSFLDQYTTYPGYRAVMYLAAAAVSSTAAFLSHKAMGQAENNIKKIDKLLEELGALQTMGTVEKNLKYHELGLSSGLQPLAATPGFPLTSADNPISCNRPLRDGQCPSIQRDLQKSRGFSGINSQLGEIGSLATGIADDITGSSSLSAGTVKNIENLGTKNAIAKRGLRQLEAEENKRRKEAGSKPVDYSQQSRSLIDRLTKVGKSALESNGSSAEGLLAAMGYPESMRSNSEEAKGKVAGVLRESNGLTGSNGNKAVFDASENEKFSFDFGEEESEEEIFQGDIGEYGSDMYAKAFEAQASRGSDQIVGDRDVSIFRVISVRYMKSGLPRLLNQLNSNKKLQDLE
jgi:hypothetical protein